MLHCLYDNLKKVKIFLIEPFQFEELFKNFFFKLMLFLSFYFCYYYELHCDYTTVFYFCLYLDIYYCSILYIYPLQVLGIKRHALRKKMQNCKFICPNGCRLCR